MIYNAREFVVVVQSLSFVQLFVTLWTAVCQASLSFTIPQSLLKLMSHKFANLCAHKYVLLLRCCSLWLGQLIY